MSVTNPAYPIPRWSVVGMEGMFVKMWDPPTESPVTPDEIAPTNPVPEVMAAAGLALTPIAPHTMQLDLLHNLAIPTWDGLKTLNFFTFANPDIAATLNGTYPGTTVRVPVGAVFHCSTRGKGPPPHTIHWHGIEPTPMNDGVGHCSMEIGGYTYQWQPTFIGTYFYHCHRNTMQHFEYGLFGLLVFEPADAYHATLVDPTIAIGHCRDGKRRTGAALANFPQFPGWNPNPRDAADPWTGNPALKFPSDPHGHTVPYDVEALWVFDDRDSTWSDLATSATTTFPAHGPHPGYDDNFARNPGINGFLAFNDFGADYWFVTGTPVPARAGGTGAIPAGLVIPPELNSGISGSQISVEAYVGQTILIRCLDAAYNNCTYTFPMDVVIIEWDGRPLGVPPYGYNHAYLVPAGTPIEASVGRRYGALIREFAPRSSFATAQFIDTRGAHVQGYNQVLCTVQVPINISALTVTATSDKPSPQPPGTAITFTAAMTGNPGSQAPTGGAYEYRFYLNEGKGAGFVLKQDYSATQTWTWTPAATGAFDVFVEVRTVGSPNVRDAYTEIFAFETVVRPATGLTLTPDKSSPETLGQPVTFTATQQGGVGTMEYRFYVNDGSGAGFVLMRDYTLVNTWQWAPAATGNYDIFAEVRLQGSAVVRDAFAAINFYQITASAPTGVALAASLPSPQGVGVPVTFTATPQGGTGPFEYRFYLNDGSGTGFVLKQAYSAANTWQWTPAATGNYDVFVEIRTQGSTVQRDAFAAINFYQIQGVAPATGVTLTANLLNSQTAGTPQTFNAAASGGSGSYEYRFYVNNGSGTGYVLQGPYGASANFVYTPPAAGHYDFFVEARSVGSTSFRDVFATVLFYSIN